MASSRRNVGHGCTVLRHVCGRHAEPSANGGILRYRDVVLFLPSIYYSNGMCRCVHLRHQDVASASSFACATDGHHRGAGIHGRIQIWTQRGELGAADLLQGDAMEFHHLATWESFFLDVAAEKDIPVT